MNRIPLGNDLWAEIDEDEIRLYEEPLLGKPELIELMTLNTFDKLYHAYTSYLESLNEQTTEGKAA